MDTLHLLWTHSVHLVQTLCLSKFYDSWFRNVFFPPRYPFFCEHFLYIWYKLSASANFMILDLRMLYFFLDNLSFVNSFWTFHTDCLCFSKFDFSWFENVVFCCCCGNLQHLLGTVSTHLLQTFPVWANLIILDSSMLQLELFCIFRVGNEVAFWNVWVTCAAVFEGFGCVGYLSHKPIGQTKTSSKARGFLLTMTH